MLQSADKGDTTTQDETLCEAVMTVAELASFKRSWVRTDYASFARRLP